MSHKTISVFSVPRSASLLNFKPGVRTVLLFAVGLGFWLAAAGSSLAQSSATSISFQGALTGAGGQPLPSGSYTLGFQFWDHPTGTAASNRVGGAVTVPGVAVSGGVASTAIPVQPEWFNGQTRYLGTTIQDVNAGQELLPRVLVTAVPYAISAEKLRESVFVASNGNVGVGTANPSAILDVRGTAKVEALRTDGFVGIGLNGAEPDGAVLDVRGGRTKVERLAIVSEIHNQALEVFASGGESSIVDINKTTGTANSPILRVFRDRERIDETLVFTILRDGRVGMGTSGNPAPPVPQASLEVNGTTRTTVLQITSARAAKEGFAPVDAAAVLAKVAALPLATWAYTNSPGVRHVGPVAEDFHAAFGLGDSAQHIATVDADGVALAAIQGLHQIVQEQQSTLRARESEVQSPRERLEKLERLVTELAGQRKEAQ